MIAPSELYTVILSVGISSIWYIPVTDDGPMRIIHILFSVFSAEVVFLVFGIYLCYRVRAAPSEYSEGTYVSAAICYECFISTVFYILR